MHQITNLSLTQNIKLENESQNNVWNPKVFLQSLKVSIANRTPKKILHASSICFEKKVSYTNPQFQHDIIVTFFSLPYFLDSTFGLLILISSVRLKSSIWYLGFLANFKLSGKTSVSQHNSNHLVFLLTLAYKLMPSQHTYQYSSLMKLISSGR